MPIDDIDFVPTNHTVWACNLTTPNLKFLNNVFSRGGTSLFISLLDSADPNEYAEYVIGRRCVLPRSRARTFPIEKGHLINANS